MTVLCVATRAAVLHETINQRRPGTGRPRYVSSAAYSRSRADPGTNATALTRLDRRLHLSSEEDAFLRKTTECKERLGLLLILIPTIASAALVLMRLGGAGPAPRRSRSRLRSRTRRARTRRLAVAGSAAVPPAEVDRDVPDAGSPSGSRSAGGAGSGDSRCSTGAEGRHRRPAGVVPHPDTPEHDSTPAPGARARPDFRHWRTICLRRQD